MERVGADGSVSLPSGSAAAPAARLLPAAGGSGGRRTCSARWLEPCGEAEPAAVLSGAFLAHFPPDISSVPKDEKMEVGEAQALARHGLGEAAYSAARAGRRNGQ
jgi:hypothetical protein